MLTLELTFKTIERIEEANTFVKGVIDGYFLQITKKVDSESTADDIVFELELEGFDFESRIY